MLTGYDKFYTDVEANHGKFAGEIWDTHTLATYLNGLIASRNGNGPDEDVESNAGSEGRLERDFDSS